MNTKISTVKFEKKLSPKLEKYFNNPICKRRLKSLEKGKNEKHIKHKKKKKNKNRIFSNSLLQTTLNPYLQTLFL